MSSLLLTYLSFMARYRREFGFDIPGRKIYVDDIRVRGIGRSTVDVRGPESTATGPPTPKKVVVVAIYFYYIVLYTERIVQWQIQGGPGGTLPFSVEPSIIFSSV